jgi:hypothetical protein
MCISDRAGAEALAGPAKTAGTGNTPAAPAQAPRP